MPATEKIGSSEIFSAAVNLPAPKTPWHELGYIALNNLLDEGAQGFLNTRHIMPFAKEIFNVNADSQEGDVFQRALIADTLIDFNEDLQGRLDEIIKSEIAYLISKGRKKGIGGWAYFPDLPELPPDADDLAQVMQVLVRGGYKVPMAALIDTPLHVLLGDQQNDDAWESWIIPKLNQTEEQLLQTVWVNKAWGTGSDPEVVANLLYALILYDPDRYSSAISRGLNYLSGIHAGKYRWISTWYHGEHYGTYVAIRALCAGNADSAIIRRAADKIRQCRHSDGSWGIDKEVASPLQTALALLTLSIAQQYTGQKWDYSWAENSLRYLQQSRKPDNNWAESPFIRMPMGRPYGYIHTILTYESKAITSNYIAKACNHICQNHLNDS